MKWLFRRISRGGEHARLTVLMFHRVTALPDPLFPGEVHRESFDRICGWVRRWFTVLPLDEAVERLYDGQLPAGALAITFDDGYADNHDVALPVLSKHGLNATFFVATGFLDGGRMWNDTLVEAIRHARVDTIDLRELSVPGLDYTASPPRLSLQTLESRREAVRSLIGLCKYLEPAERLAQVERIAALTGANLPDDLMMSSSQVSALHRAGMRIGAHTCSHPILRRLSDEDARTELAGSRDRLAEITGSAIELFAYPNGKPGNDYSERDARLAAEVGFRAAFSTRLGAATANCPRYELPRFTPWRRGRWGFAAQLGQNLVRASS